MDSQLENKSKVAIAWFTFTAFFFMLDALFLNLRPRSLPGGDLAMFFFPYEYYVEVDKTYGASGINDEFVIAQSWLCIAEAFLDIITVVLLLKKSKAAILCGFLVSTMTSWKTLLFWSRTFPIFGGGHMLAHAPWGGYLFWIAFPSCLWIFGPAAFVYAYGKIILKALNDMKEKTG